VDIKGVAFLARQAQTEARFGAEAWRNFITDYARQEPLFAQPVMPVTRIPVAAFIALNEALLRAFHGGDEQAWWELGESSARYAMEQGQLRGLFAPGDFRRFLQGAPSIWRGYYTAGELSVEVGSEATDLHIRNVPFPHVYFEFAVMGFVKAGLELLGAKGLRYEALLGFSRGDGEVHYRFHVRS
jgi:hypothetical protein